MIRKILKAVAAVFAILLLLLGAAAWVETHTAPRLLAVVNDAVFRAVSGRDPYRRCWVSKDDVTRFIGPRACFTYGPPRKFVGLYIDEFEGQRFLEGVAGGPPYRATDRVWFSYDAASDLTKAPLIADHDDPRTRVFEISFVGRKTSRGEHGHFGMSDSEVIVDRVESAKLVLAVDGYLSPAAFDRDIDQ